MVNNKEKLLILEDPLVHLLFKILIKTKIKIKIINKVI
jgi:hypothetical protein